MKKFVVTNNKLVVEKYAGNNIHFIDGDFIDVLVYVRDKIQLGYKLLTHPLCSNFLPDKTIYKTIIIKNESEVDLQSVTIIENALVLARDSLPRRDNKIMREDILEDLKFVDYQVIKHSLEKIGG